MWIKSALLFPFKALAWIGFAISVCFLATVEAFKAVPEGNGGPPRRPPNIPHGRIDPPIRTI